jgi:hypothetical protein
VVEAETAARAEFKAAKDRAAIYSHRGRSVGGELTYEHRDRRAQVEADEPQLRASEATITARENTWTRHRGP